jgi:DNA-binding CsgD family transcriptional regulator
VTSQGDGLSEAAKAIDQASAKLRRVDPDRALLLWKGVVEGRWSLVDHFDSDGMRFVVAKRKSVPIRAWHTLTERELQTVSLFAQGQMLRIIACQLGVSPSTVSGELAHAQSKLGVGNRLELAAAYRAWHAEEGQP